MVRAPDEGYPQPPMASDRATLKVSEREEFGSRTTRRLRRSGFVPGVVYGGGREARAFQVPERDLRAVLTHGGALIDVVFDGGKPTPVVVKEQQRHPVRGSVVHIDLLEVKLDEEIEADVPVELVGADEAPGVDEGGVLEHVTRELTIRALPTAIPDSIVADVSGMAINDTLQLSALVPPEGVEFVADEPDEVTIATLSPPRIEEEPEVEEEAELVGEEGEEGEAAEAPEGEAPEGEAPAEPEGSPEGE
jgi:large subunit ribosomal protein L25